MSDAKNSTTKKVLRSQRRVMNWTMRLVDLVVLVLLAGLWIGY